MNIIQRSWGPFGVLAVLLTACPGTSGEGDDGAAAEGTSSGSAGVCTPGDEISCACTDGSMSTQTCEPDGSSYGECECGNADSSGGMADTGMNTSGPESSTGMAEGTTSGEGSSGGPGETEAGCMPGTASACDCPEGPGFQPCNDEGEIGPCQCCEGSHPLVEDTLRYCEEGHCYCGNLELEPPVDVCFIEAIAAVCCPDDITLECY